MDALVILGFQDESAAVVHRVGAACWHPCRQQSGRSRHNSTRAAWALAPSSPAAPPSANRQTRLHGAGRAAALALARPVQRGDLQRA